jgi:hypothetical protein
MANIKNWSEFLKDVPTDALVSEIENRKEQKSGSYNPFLSELATEIMKKIDEAIKRFGSYSFDDKGPDEVMDIDSVTAKLKGKPVKEIGSILSEILDNYSDSKRALRFVECIIGEFDYLPEDEFTELLESDERFEY